MQALALAARNHAEMDDTTTVAGSLPADKSSFRSSGRIWLGLWRLRRAA